MEHITGSARYSAPGLDIISVRSEDLLEDLELEVITLLSSLSLSLSLFLSLSLSLLIWDHLVSVITSSARPEPLDNTINCLKESESVVF